MKNEGEGRPTGGHSPVGEREDATGGRPSLAEREDVKSEGGRPPSGGKGAAGDQPPTKGMVRV